MANTIQSRTLVGAGASKILVLHIHITSDGTQETNTVVYNNSAFVNNTAKGNLMSVTAMGADCQLTFKWQQTTDSVACAINPTSAPYRSFKGFGGIGNPNAAGATGNLRLTTTGLAATEEVTIILEIFQN